MNPEEKLLRNVMPAVMPPEMRSRLLSNMAGDNEEVLADQKFETMLRASFAPEAMSAALQKQITREMRNVARLPRMAYKVRRVCAVLVVALFPAVLFVLWYLKAENTVLPVPQVSLHREYHGGTRYDTFVLETEDKTRLHIRVKCPVPSRLPDDVI